MNLPDSALDRMQHVERLTASLEVTTAMQRQRLGRGLVSALADARGSNDAWPLPLPLPDLPPVDPFNHELLPPVLADVARDIADRMQCPVDYVAVALVILMAAAIGRRCAIRPKRHDNWTEVPNLWGMIIGRPGVMKTPAMQEVLSSMHHVERLADDTYELAQEEFTAAELINTERERVQKGKIRKALMRGNLSAAEGEANRVVVEGIEPPVRRRFILNDTTVEKLGEILSENPQGLLLLRDELSGFFRVIESPGHEADRAFYLECWNGKQPFTYDRIGRGTIRIEAACLSILGTIQPGPLAEIVRGTQGKRDDGLIQRFQLAVWPDVSRKWKNVDRQPNQIARQRLEHIVIKLVASREPKLGEGAEAFRTFKFSDTAQALFEDWHASLEHELRSGSEHESVEGHLAKYRKLVPALALIFHLVDLETAALDPELFEPNEAQTATSISPLAVERAIGWAKYLRTHARRIYSPATDRGVDAARHLLAKIESGRLAAPFTMRDVYQHGWTALANRDAVAAAVGVLEDFDWLRREDVATGGRPQEIFHVNPAMAKAEVR
jgi:putative DNA primase/helicase